MANVPVDAVAPAPSANVSSASSRTAVTPVVPPVSATGVSGPPGTTTMPVVGAATVQPVVVATTPGVTDAFTGFYSPSTSNVTTPTGTGAVVLAPSPASVTVPGWKHFVMPAPIRRWDGTSWVLVYVPKI